MRIWWSNEPNDSLYLRTYLAEYRGIIKWLVHNHVPFDIVVRPQADELSAYDAVIAPSPAALSERGRSVARPATWRMADISSSPVRMPAMLDEFGNPRAAPAVAALDAAIARARGRRRRHRRADARRSGVPYAAAGSGRIYLTSGSPEASAAIGELLGAQLAPVADTPMPPRACTSRSGRWATRCCCI